jgi:TRAP-type C4-dicarboxylate transport system permease small subunit
VTKVRSLVEAVTGACAALAAVGLLGLMLLTVVDVIRREVTGRSIQGAIELAPLILLGAVVLGLGHGEMTKTHVRTTLVTARLPTRWRAGVRLVAYLICLALLVWWIDASFDRAVDAYNFGDATPGFVGIPTWHVRALVPIGLTLFAVALALRAYDEVQTLRGKERLEHEVAGDPENLEGLGAGPEARS